MKTSKRQRGTAIVETDLGIVLTQIQKSLFLLPGGKSEKNEIGIITAIRELKEETDLDAQSAIFLFDHESQHYYHKVFYIKASGNPTPSNEITKISYFNQEIKDQISYSSQKIIDRFLHERYLISSNFSR